LADKQEAIVKYLVDHGADLNVKSRSGYTVAAAAVEGDNVNVLKKLFTNGLKLTDPVNTTGWTVLHMAAYHNAANCLELIMAQPGAKVDLPMEDGSTALFLAAEKNGVDSAKVLLKYGADVNHTDHRKITALHHAALGGSAEVIKFLLQMGANPAATSISNVSVLDTAERNHKQAAADLIKEALEKSEQPKAGGS
jgi:ankyrin repeat protein